jgi:hypothetical protein
MDTCSQNGVEVNLNILFIGKNLTKLLHPYPK